MTHLKQHVRFAGLFFLLLFTLTSAWKQGPVTRAQVLSDLLTNAAKSIAYYNTTYTWSESAGDWSNAPYVWGKPSCYWVDAMLFLALDGTDEQVAITGLTRDELFRRVRAPKSFSEGTDQTLLNKIKVYDRTTWLAAVAKADSAWKLPRVKTVFPEKAKIIRLGFTDGMDYGRAQLNCITMRPVPQDFADPRRISDRPIKDWMRNWKCSRLGWGGDADTGTLAVVSYSPDFASDHHGGVHLDYHICPDASNYHNGHFTEMFTKLLDGKAIYERWTDTLTHMYENHFYELKLMSSNGYGVPPVQIDRTLHYCQFEAVVCATIFKDKEALAFVNRIVEMFNRGSFGYLQPFISANLGAYSYLLLRLVPDYPDSAPSFQEAKRKVDGVSWFRPHQFIVQRTPEKYVSIGWNASSRAYGGDLLVGQFRDTTDQVKARARGPVLLNYFPDGADDSLLFDVSKNRIVPLVAQGGSMDGGDLAGNPGLFISRGAPGSSGVRVDRNDAMFSATRRIAILESSSATANYVERGFEYLSFTSFADKSAICMVRMMRAKGISSFGSSSWTKGFGQCYYVHPTNIPHRVDCAYEAGTIDMNKRAAVTLNSNWYCVNDMVGVAVVGGSGTFKIANGNIYNTASYELGGDMVSYTQSLKSSDTLMDLAALFFVSTKAADVKRLGSAAINLDNHLPLGWKGMVVPTPDSQRVMALVRFYGDVGSTQLKMRFDEGAPVFERLTTFSNDSAIATFAFDSLESWGQTLGFYVSGQVTSAEQIGDLSVRLKGTGSTVVKYLSRADNNTVYVNGTKSVKTKAELKAGLNLTLSDTWTTVRVENILDDDHTPPSVEIKNPLYLTDEQCKLLGTAQKDNFPDPDKVIIGEEGLNVNIYAKDRSGVAWVKVYLNWDSVGMITQEPYELVIPKAKFDGDSIHAIHAITCDNLGNQVQSVSSTFKVPYYPGTAIERVQGRQVPVSRAAQVAVNKTVSGIAEQTVAQGAKSNASLIISMEHYVASGRVKPDAGNIDFSHNGTDYSMKLSAKTNRISLFRKNQDRTVLLGEAMVKTMPGKWYELKVQASDGRLIGFVNGKEMVSVSN